MREFEQNEIRLQAEPERFGWNIAHLCWSQRRFFLTVKGEDARPFHAHHVEREGGVWRGELRTIAEEFLQPAAEIAQGP